jgi:ATP phosphoribosyltransferase regulatory subunit
MSTVTKQAQSKDEASMPENVMNNLAMPLRLAPLEGTKDSLPALSATRYRVLTTLRALYDQWGYASVEVPAIEAFEPEHPAAHKAFKLVDGSDVLMLRADFTPSIARLIQAQEAPRDRAAANIGRTGVYRYQYAGTLWQAINPDVARTREFSQIGLELIGISSHRADAELIHLARESVRAVGLSPRVELGNPGLIRTLFALADIPTTQQDTIARTIDRKDVASLARLLEPYNLAPDVRDALLATPDWYGGIEVLAKAKQALPWPEVTGALEHLDALIDEFEDSSELRLDLGMARRLDYYTGVTFRAYTSDSAQPLLGGGRYDGALLEHAAGFALGLERIVSALPHQAPEAPIAVSLDDPAARKLRGAGYKVVRALATTKADIQQEAHSLGALFVLADGVLEPVAHAAQPDDATHTLGMKLQAIIDGAIETSSSSQQKDHHHG